MTLLSAMASQRRSVGGGSGQLPSVLARHASPGAARPRQGVELNMNTSRNRNKDVLSRVASKRSGLSGDMGPDGSSLSFYKSKGLGSNSYTASSSRQYTSPLQARSGSGENVAGNSSKERANMAHDNSEPTEDGQIAAFKSGLPFFHAAHDWFKLNTGRELMLTEAAAPQEIGDLVPDSNQPMPAYQSMTRYWERSLLKSQAKKKFSVSFALPPALIDENPDIKFACDLPSDLKRQLRVAFAFAYLQNLHVTPSHDLIWKVLQTVPIEDRHITLYSRVQSSRPDSVMINPWPVHQEYWTPDVRDITNSFRRALFVEKCISSDTVSGAGSDGDVLNLGGGGGDQDVDDGTAGGGVNPPAGTGATVSTAVINNEITEYDTQHKHRLQTPPFFQHDDHDHAARVVSHSQQQFKLKPGPREYGVAHQPRQSRQRRGQGHRGRTQSTFANVDLRSIRQSKRYGEGEGEGERHNHGSLVMAASASFASDSGSEIEGEDEGGKKNQHFSPTSSPISSPIDTFVNPGYKSLQRSRSEWGQSRLTMSRLGGASNMSASDSESSESEEHEAQDFPLLDLDNKFFISKDQALLSIETYTDGMSPSIGEDGNDTNHDHDHDQHKETLLEKVLGLDEFVKLVGLLSYFAFSIHIRPMRRDPGPPLKPAVITELLLCVVSMHSKVTKLANNLARSRNVMKKRPRVKVKGKKAPVTVSASSRLISRKGFVVTDLVPPLLFCIESLIKTAFPVWSADSTGISVLEDVKDMVFELFDPQRYSLKRDDGSGSVGRNVAIATTSALANITLGEATDSRARSLLSTREMKMVMNSRSTAKSSRNGQSRSQAQKPRSRLLSVALDESKVDVLKIRHSGESRDVSRAVIVACRLPEWTYKDVAEKDLEGHASIVRELSFSENAAKLSRRRTLARFGSMMSGTTSTDYD